MHDSPGTLRLFFAVTATPAQNLALSERVAPLAGQLRAQRVPPENLHATLCFIGAVAPERLEVLRDIASALRGRGGELRFDKLEYWSKPRVLCTTAADNAAARPVHDLAGRLASSALAAGFSPDIKTFRPHLTLARKVHAASAAQCEWPLALAPPFIVQCQRFVLMQSRRGETGSVYSVLDSWPLDENAMH